MCLSRDPSWDNPQPPLARSQQSPCRQQCRGAGFRTGRLRSVLDEIHARRAEPFWTPAGDLRRVTSIGELSGSCVPRHRWGLVGLGHRGEEHKILHSSAGQCLGRLAEHPAGLCAGRIRSSVDEAHERRWKVFRSPAVDLRGFSLLGSCQDLVFLAADGVWSG